MYFVEKSYKNTQCKAYFFERWGTYKHPVTPISPLDYKDALLRKGYCRAWMCPSGETDLLVYFEAIQNTLDHTTLDKPKGILNQTIFYEKIDSGNVGSEINTAETLDKKQFFVSLPDDSKHLNLISSITAYNYQYSYDSKGRLEHVIVTNIDGEVRKIDYKQ